MSYSGQCRLQSAPICSNGCNAGCGRERAAQDRALSPAEAAVPGAGPPGDGPTGVGRSVWVTSADQVTAGDCKCLSGATGVLQVLGDSCGVCGSVGFSKSL